MRYTKTFQTLRLHDFSQTGSGIVLVETAKLDPTILVMLKTRRYGWIEVCEASITPCVDGLMMNLDVLKQEVRINSR